MALPYTPGKRPANGASAAIRANVGRDALIPPGLRRGERHGFESRGAAGVNARPTVPGKPRGQPQTRIAARFCGWDESHPYE